VSRTIDQLFVALSSTMVFPDGWRRNPSLSKTVPPRGVGMFLGPAKDDRNLLASGLQPAQQELGQSYVAGSQ
jgi:hypothetical protein